MDALQFIAFVAGLEAGRKLSDEEIRLCVVLVREMLRDFDPTLRIRDWKTTGTVKIERVLDLTKLKP